MSPKEVKDEIVSIKIQREAFGNVSNVDNYFAGYSTPLTTDTNGNTIYIMAGQNLDCKEGENDYLNSYLVMFDKNGQLIPNTGVQEIKDVLGYKEQLKEFKEASGWSLYSK